MVERIDKLNHIKSGFDRSPIVSITGLRQSGKTTLAKNIIVTSLPSILSKIRDL